MVSRCSVAIVALLLAGAPAFAENSLCDARNIFEVELRDDAPGGKFLVSEDKTVSARFRDGHEVLAEIEIIEPHRTKEFGSGIAFVFCDETQKRLVRVAFNDIAERDELHVSALQSLDRKGEWPQLIPRTALSVSKSKTNRVTFQKNSVGQLVIGAGGETFTIQPGFSMQHFKVQIFCADARVRFLDGELIS